jgi:hypothetical protein
MPGLRSWDPETWIEILGSELAPAPVLRSSRRRRTVLRCRLLPSLLLFLAGCKILLFLSHMGDENLL